jgi:regulator of cell morphogenesis and NO signaling
VSERLEAAIVANVAAADFRTIAVFERFGIDFCCGGRRSIGDACRAVAVDPEAVVRVIAALPPTAGADRVARWPLGRLIDHIVATHHAYVRTALPAITIHLNEIRKGHGSHHPELGYVVDHFNELRGDLEQHLVKEERVLFPYIRGLASGTGGRVPAASGIVEDSIGMMEHEHREVAHALDRIRVLTRGFELPEEGCTTYAICMVELEGFAADLHRHIHLENNVLFPRAVALEHGEVLTGDGEVRH